MSNPPRLLSPIGWLGLTVGLLALVGGIVWLGATHDAYGQDLIENPGGVLVAVLGTLTAAVSVVGPSLRRIDKQVSNTHTVNLRDDLDEKFAAVHRAIDNIGSDVRGVRRDIGRNTDQIAYVRQRVDSLVDRVDDLEDTVNPGKDTPT